MCGVYNVCGGFWGETVREDDVCVFFEVCCVSVVVGVFISSDEITRTIVRTRPIFISNTPT